MMNKTLQDFRGPFDKSRLGTSISKNVCLAKKIALKNANQKAIEVRRNTNRYFLEKAHDFKDPIPFRIGSFCQQINPIKVARAEMKRVPLPTRVEAKIEDLFSSNDSKSTMKTKLLDKDLDST